MTGTSLSILTIDNSEILERLPETAKVSPNQAISQMFDFFDYTREELTAVLKDKFNSSAFRATQLFEWVYQKHIFDFAQMTNLGKEFRETLAQAFMFPAARIVDRQISKDGTRKYLFEVDNGDLVESVMIKQPTRMTLCVSSQVGCGMNCQFCRTATMGFRRNLRTSEIIQQVLGVLIDAKEFDDSFSNIVFMGMGEPLHNFKGVVSALKILTDQKGLEMTPRKITVSTVGLVSAIKKFGEIGGLANLAVSLNATTDEVRSKIMPINKKFPLEVLLNSLRSFPLTSRKRITIEYVMLHGVNDTEADLKRLPKLLRGIPAKINLIPYNENAGLGFKSPPESYVAHWQDVLTRGGSDVTIRWSKGQDIKAACGQLATTSVKAVKMTAQEVSYEASHEP